MAKMTDYEIEESYKMMLDDVYGTVMIAGYEYDTSRALCECDPIAYRVGLSDYESELEQDEEDDEEDDE